LAGHDALMVADTGSGKTLTYVLPAIVHLCAQARPARRNGPVALVMTPTRELTMQVADQFRTFEEIAKLRIALAYGGVDGGGDKVVQGAKLIKGLDVVVAAPGRLLDFVEATIVNLNRATYVVLDEADLMLSMGFRDIVKALLDQIRPDRQLSLFTATWSPEIQHMADELLREPVFVMQDRECGFRYASANRNIEQKVDFVVSTNQRKVRVLEILKAEQKRLSHSKSMVFVNERRQVKTMREYLEHNQFNVVAIHNGIDQFDREKAIDKFRNSPDSVLVATDVAARGLDFQGLHCVINMFLPSDAATYVHRIGRTGRAGQGKGVAYSLVDLEDDKLNLKYLVGCVIEAKGEVPLELHEAVKTVRLPKKKEAKTPKAAKTPNALRPNKRQRRKTKWEEMRAEGKTEDEIRDLMKKAKEEAQKRWGEQWEKDKEKWREWKQKQKQEKLEQKQGKKRGKKEWKLDPVKEKEREEKRRLSRMEHQKKTWEKYMAKKKAWKQAAREQRELEAAAAGAANGVGKPEPKEGPAAKGTGPDKKPSKAKKEKTGKKTSVANGTVGREKKAKKVE